MPVCAMRNSSVLPVVTSAPDIHIAQRDHSVERRLHHPVALHFVQARQVGFRGGDVAALRGDGLFERLHVGRLRLVLGLILIVLLPRNDALGSQIRSSARP